jgi:hypothetical protein
MSENERKKVCSTTWPHRHDGTFAELGEWVKKLGWESPRIMEVGPGAVSSWLADKIAPGEGDQLSWVANHSRAFLRNLDGLLRRFRRCG